MYDPKCFDLAKAFLEDEDPSLFDEKALEELAQTIQSTIEDFIADKKGETSEDDELVTEAEGEETEGQAGQSS